MIELHDFHLSWTFLVSVTRSSFFFRGSACAQRERSTHHLVGSGPQQGDGRGSDDPPRSWQDRCPCSTWTNAMRVKKINPSEGNACAAAVLTYADWSAYLSGRSLLPFPRLASLFRYGADYVWSLSLSRNDCCCILLPNEQRCAPVKAACRSGSGPSWHLSARQLREWKQLGKRVSLCSLYGGGSEM